jgi:hypothetical protein
LEEILHAIYTLRKDFDTTKALDVVMSITKEVCFVSVIMDIDEFEALILSSIGLF